MGRTASEMWLKKYGFVNDDPVVIIVRDMRAKIDCLLDMKPDLVIDDFTGMHHRVERNGWSFHMWAIDELRSAGITVEIFGRDNDWQRITERYT
jgi:hypothetical protein